jgi:uncharacterized membrane protein YGL010W
VFGYVIVAPFTQLTFMSFEHQAFLYGVFHQSRLARLFHGVFMPCVVFFLMAFFAQFRVPLETLSFSGAHVLGVALSIWYVRLAWSVRLRAWGVLSAVLTTLLAIGADAYHLRFAAVGDPAWYASTSLAASPLLWMWVSAYLVMCGHFGERAIPPRVGERWTWQRTPEHFLGTREKPSTMGGFARATLNVFTQSLLGTINEWWASPRLAPYGLLFVMFEAGYAPERHARHRDFVERAIASGNPALDYVGVGGGAYLDPDYVERA